MAAAATAEKEQKLPELEDGEIITFSKVSVLAKKTRAPTAYTEGTLGEDMKAAGKYVEDPELRKALKMVSGLGTAATRADVFEALKHQAYVEKKGKHIVATEKGIQFITWLERVCPELCDVATTARWEAQLSVVAEKGGGSAFEAAIADKVREMVSILKTTTSLREVLPSTALENKKMSDEKRVNKPTDKMLEFAKRIATKLNVTVASEVLTDFDACKQFIDENKDSAMKPTDKQLSFAERIAKDKSLEIPDEARLNGRVLSQWIDDNKS